MTKPKRPGRPRKPNRPELVSQTRAVPPSVFANILGTSASTVDRLVREGMPQNVDSTFDLSQCFVWMRSVWLDSRRAAASAKNGEVELARLRAVKCLREELRLAKE